MEEDADAGGVSFALPDGTRERISYFVTLPLLLAMAYTLPDCRKDKWRKWYGPSLWARSSGLASSRG